MAEKVLLIDDEEEFIEALGERMRARGMIVTATTSPVQALKQVEEESYDAVVLDLQMPEMDGIEALKIMKNKRPELQVILLTGHASVQKGIEAMKLGAMDLIEKPADFETIAAKIHRAQAKKMILVEKKNEETIKEILNRKCW
ncbi:MAG: response regulator [Thermodesulfobacteriota bacterium]